MLLERRKWFRVLTAVIGFVAVCVCWFFVYSALEPRAGGARFALFLLVLGAIRGFERLLTTFFPLVLTKIWPRLDR